MMSEIIFLPRRCVTNLNKKYPIPRKYIKETSRDKRDFNDKYILAVTKRNKALRYSGTLPAKVAVIGKFGFWVDNDYPQFPKHRLRK